MKSMAIGIPWLSSNDYRELCTYKFQVAGMKNMIRKHITCCSALFQHTIVALALTGLFCANGYPGGKDTHSRSSS